MIRIKRDECFGLVLALLTVGFNLFFLAPELRIGVLPPNDSLLHLVAAERMLQAFLWNEPFLDPWVSNWVFGYPLWHSYQPFPSILGGFVIWLTQGILRPEEAFAALEYLLISLLPLSFYFGSRLFGLGPIAAGFVAIFSIAPGEEKLFGWYGLGYAGTTWRGSGLYTQLVAIHFFLYTLGLIRRYLDEGRTSVLPAIGLVVTSLSHIIFGYVAFFCAFLIAVSGASQQRATRLARLPRVFFPALSMLLWFVIPLFLHKAEIHHSIYEHDFKWDSHGAPVILKALFTGKLLDGTRFPVLSLCLLVGFLTALYLRRSTLSERLLVLFLVWLCMFFGRETWGYVMIFFGVPRDLHMHRFEPAFVTFSLLLAGWGLQELLTLLKRSQKLLCALGCCLLLSGIYIVAKDRIAFLADNAKWGEESLRAFANVQSDVDNMLALVQQILAEKPGRVFAGPSNGWGWHFLIGSDKAYSVPMRHHLDNATFASHSMSHTSDLLFHHHEENFAQDIALGIRVVIAPIERAMPKHLRFRGSFGKIAVYESSPEGYFGLVDVVANTSGSPEELQKVNWAWMNSSLLSSGQVVALNSKVPGVPTRPVDDALPPAPTVAGDPLGEVLGEQKTKEVYTAQYKILRPSFALLKITWFPGLVAEVDGVRAPVVKVTPGFAAIPLGVGKHEVKVWYEPGPLRPLLFGLGIFLFLFSLIIERSKLLYESLERQLSTRISSIKLPTSPRTQFSLLFALSSFLALRPLFRGKYLLGHDANSYPQRVVEMVEALQAGAIPPLWSANLNCGHGLPLFEFAPPLLYYIAACFRVLGCNLGDSLHFSLALLHVLGAVAMYKIARLWKASRLSSLAASSAWLFAPYTSLDLYVRAAFAESAAVATSPLALFGLMQILERANRKRIALGSVCIALPLLCHFAISVLLLPLLVSLILIETLRLRSLKLLLSAGLTLFGGLMLSGFSWIPGYLERDFVQVELLRKDFLHWRQHFVAPWQLLASPWGFGFSGEGDNDGMSFIIGLPQLLLALLGIFITLRGPNSDHRRQVALFFFAAMCGVWLSTEYSDWLWSRIPTLQYFAYPWRTLFLPGLLLPLITIPAFEWLRPRLRIGALAILLLLNIKHTEPAGYQEINPETYQPKSIATSCMGVSTRNEYSPIWNETPLEYWDKELRAQGSIQPSYEILNNKPELKEFKLKSPITMKVESSVFYFPGWKVFLNGKEIESGPTPTRGTIFFELPPGIHNLRLELQNTGLRKIANAVSVLAAMAIFGLLLQGVIRKKFLGAALSDSATPKKGSLSP